MCSHTLKLQINGYAGGLDKKCAESVRLSTIEICKKSKEAAVPYCLNAN